MFYLSQSKLQQTSYREKLQLIGSLSQLFSDSVTPYLYYRIAEKLFCQAFEADDLSRSDVSDDAKKGNLGIGLKTFLYGNGKSFQKVAEFNSDRELYDTLSPEKLVRQIALLRNERIRFTQNLHALDSSIYHCVLREKNRFKLFEESMNYIDLECITDVKSKKSSIVFNDGIHEYSFLRSKSTLTKRFVTETIVDEFEVDILDNPLDALKNCLNDYTVGSEGIVGTVFLPLYGSNKKVYERSGLNQWNAEGRARDENEVYIPIPILIHQNFPHFFPDRDTPFDLKLPHGANLQSKVCQEGSKALMSYSNKALGKWILRDVLSLNVGELVTYQKLQVIGIDAVRIDKFSDGTYSINFAAINSYENFVNGL